MAGHGWRNREDAMNLKGRHFLTLKDYTPEEITYLLDLAADLKDKKKKGVLADSLRGKNVALIFEKTSTRTRCAFEVAAHDLCMGTTYLDPSGSQIGKKESIADTARVLGRMYEGIEYRGFGQEIVEELAKYAGVPVWNGLTNEDHPTQMLADLLTIREHLGCLKGLKLVYYGKFRYQEQKKAQEAKARQKVIQVKEVKFRPVTDENDFQTKLRSLVRFLTDGDKAKVTLRFRGREMAHQHFGMELMNRIRTELDEIAQVEHQPKLEGRQMIMVLAPKKKK